MNYDEAHLLIRQDLNEIRSLVINIERIMRVMHQQRHPVPKPEVDLSPTQPLDSEVRAEIDVTP